MGEEDDDGPIGRLQGSTLVHRVSATETILRYLLLCFLSPPIIASARAASAINGFLLRPAPAGRYTEEEK